MSENQEERKKKKEMGMDIGRMLGVLAREDPELYTALKEYAEKNNMEMHDAVTTLLKKQFLHQKLTYSNINVEQLLVAWDILKDLIVYSTNLYTSLSTLFFSDMTKAYSELIEQKIQEKMEKQAQTPSPQPLDSKLREKLLKMIDPLIDMMMGMAMGTAGLKVPDSMKVKIPVTYEVEEANTSKVESNSVTQSNTSEV